jgi:hypothetical protein
MIQNFLNTADKSGSGLVHAGIESGAKKTDSEHKGLFGLLFKALSYSTEGEADIVAENESDEQKNTLAENPAEKVNTQTVNAELQNSQIAAEVNSIHVADKGGVRDEEGYAAEIEIGKTDKTAPVVNRIMQNNDGDAETGAERQSGMESDADNDVIEGSGHRIREAASEAAKSFTRLEQLAATGESIVEPVTSDQTSAETSVTEVQMHVEHHEQAGQDSNRNGMQSRTGGEYSAPEKTKVPLKDFGKEFSGLSADRSAKIGTRSIVTDAERYSGKEPVLKEEKPVNQPEMQRSSAEADTPALENRENEPVADKQPGLALKETQRGIELRKMRAELLKEIRQKSEQRATGTSFGSDSLTGRKPLLSLLNSTENRMPVFFVNESTFGQVQLNESETEAESASQFWKEFTPEAHGHGENQPNELLSQAISRMTQTPVANISVKRNVLPGLTQTVQQAASPGKANGESWQKHNFVMDDGKKIEVSVRQVEGVLQLKLGSSSPELNRLLQQYNQEIREHLEKEISISIDLQFDGNGEDSGARFADSDSHDSQRSLPHSGSGSSSGSTGETDGKTKADSTVRNFGYNRMEWTA